MQLKSPGEIHKMCGSVLVSDFQLHLRRQFFEFHRHSAIQNGKFLRFKLI